MHQKNKIVSMTENHHSYDLYTAGQNSSDKMVGKFQEKTNVHGVWELQRHLVIYQNK